MFRKKTIPSSARVDADEGGEIKKGTNKSRVRRSYTTIVFYRRYMYLSLLFFITFVFFLACNRSTTQPSQFASTFTYGRPPQCTRDQLLKVRAHLDPNACINTIKRPYIQECSLTLKTRCPDFSNWLEEYYADLQKEYIAEQERQTNTDQLSATMKTKDHFVGISVGCNKGFDALNTLRMGTFDEELSKSAWGEAMIKDGEIHNSVCKQDSTSAFHIDYKLREQSIGKRIQHRTGEVHCFEPMPVTATSLKKSAEILEYDKKGFKVIHSAVAKTSGKALFPSANMKSGVENKGLANCDNRKQRKNCEEVQVISLERYVNDHVKSDGPIHILQIDVEGFDGDVILGAGDKVLSRVEYLEFEYNWMGSWKRQHLHDIVEMLDGQEFTCYWTGERRLWRITGCWMMYFDVHTWSNVACVNRKRVPKLASKMENVFQQTLKEDMPAPYHSDTHEILSIDPVIMTAKYLSHAKS